MLTQRVVLRRQPLNPGMGASQSDGFYFDEQIGVRQTGRPAAQRIGILKQILRGVYPSPSPLSWGQTPPS
jgi:hypothetical protein